jgi:hypothetical protein
MGSESTLVDEIDDTDIDDRTVELVYRTHCHCALVGMRSETEGGTKAQAAAYIIANRRSNHDKCSEQPLHLEPGSLATHEHLVHDEAARIRVARRVLTLFGNSDGYVDNVVGHQVSSGPPLSIRAGQSPVPVEVADLCRSSRNSSTMNWRR